jgi:aminoglycoside phosphotransferase
MKILPIVDWASSNVTRAFTSSQRSRIGDRIHRVDARSSQGTRAGFERRTGGVDIVDEDGVMRWVAADPDVDAAGRAARGGGGGGA